MCVFNVYGLNANNAILNKIYKHTDIQIITQTSVQLPHTKICGDIERILYG